LEFRLEFLEDAFVVVFPELLRGVLSGDPGEDLLAACEAASVGCSWPKGLGWAHTWMLILELRQVVDVLVDGDIEVVWLVVRCDVCLGEGFRHLVQTVVLQSVFRSQSRAKGRRRSTI
jgi:hypothetical protein